MNKIYNQLTEIKNLLKDNVGQKIDSITNSNVAQDVQNQIKTQNNFFNSYKTFKPLVNYKNKINVRKQITDNQNMIFYGFAIYLFVIVILLILKSFPNFFSTNFPTFNIFSESFISWSILIIILIISFFTLSIIRRQGNLKIEENKITIKFNFYNKKEQTKYNEGVEYINIRSILKQKTIAGYAIFICKIDELEPYIQFNVDSIHTALAIEELIISKISKATIKIPNDETLEAIKDVLANQNMTKVSLEDLKKDLGA